MDSKVDSKILFKALGGLVITWVCLVIFHQITEVFKEQQVLLYLIAFSVVIYLAYKGARDFKQSDGEQGMVIYFDYLDVFKCFSVVVVPPVIAAIFESSALPNLGLFLAWSYFIVMVVHICYLAAMLNQFKDLPVVFITKFLVSIIWLIAMFQSLNPSGGNREQRRTSRNAAVVVLLIFTPLLRMFVVDDKGKELIKGPFKGRRFTGARFVRDTLK